MKRRQCCKVKNYVKTTTNVELCVIHHHGGGNWASLAFSQRKSVTCRSSYSPSMPLRQKGLFCDSFSHTNETLCPCPFFYCADETQYVLTSMFTILYSRCPILSRPNDRRDDKSVKDALLRSTYSLVNIIILYMPDYLNGDAGDVIRLGKEVEWFVMQLPKKLYSVQSDKSTADSLNSLWFVIS